jgi:Fe(3+) dicitrate transport protein
MRMSTRAGIGPRGITQAKARQVFWNTLCAISLVMITSVMDAAAQQAMPELSGGAPILLPRVDVIGTMDDLLGIPGTAHVIDQETLERSQPFTVNEALRKVPGIHVRDEEGFGLRPNIGIRGLNPTRSTKTTLLEDGVPLAYAPYGDNASYYFPPIDRFERIEVLKGVTQLLYGPQTIGGTLNFITPVPPQTFSGFIALEGGNRDYFDGKLRVGGKGLLFDYTRKQGDGSRDNLFSELNDINLKAVLPFSATHGLTFRANVFTEDSTVTYSGLTDAEFRMLGPRYNPFKNDEFEIDRYGASVTHELGLGGTQARVLTNLYFSYFQRDWWRQSSTTTDNQCGAAFTAARLAGQRVDPDTCNSAQGRLRNYYTYGITPRLLLDWTAFGYKHEFEAGVRAHVERQDREQVNATSPTGRSGTLVEDNLRETQAYSGFVANRFSLGQWAIMPIIRYEFIDSSRTNRLTGVKGSDTLGEVVPGLGMTWTPIDRLTVFAGAHRGFAPPRTEDIISGVGTSTDVGAEDSINWEIGLRAEPFQGANLQAAFFQNRFSRLIAVGSIAGGNTPLAEGEALFQGIEFSGQLDLPMGFYLRSALTWLPTAEQETPFRQVVGGAVVPGSAAGLRQPYAPEILFTGAIGYAWRGFDAQLEVVHVGSQFSDFANTPSALPNDTGQVGEIDAYTILNLALSYYIQPLRTTAFASVKNLTDETYITDRTRGIQVGMPFLIHGGLKYAW